jgi:hypothetical protein
MLSARVARWFFFNQKSHFGKSFEGLRLENVDIFYDHLEYFTDICVPFGIFCVYLVHFVFIWYIFPVLVPHTNKNLATLLSAALPLYHVS